MGKATGQFFPLGEVHLAQFRLFDRLTWSDLDPHLNVIVAPNGGGKTALLDAIAAGLAPFPRRFARTSGGELVDWDVPRRRVEGGATLRVVEDTVVRLSVAATAGVGAATWTVTRGPGATSRTRASGAAVLATAATRASTARLTGVPLPLVARYGTQRVNSEPNLTTRRRQHEVENGYLDCLDPRVAYRGFEQWVSDVSHDRANTHSGTVARAQWEFLEECLRRALAPLGLDRFEFAAQEGTIVTSDGAGPMVPLTRLSDGARAVVALVGDLARRACLLNAGIPGFDIGSASGVVLVDEIDLHLHPSWQQRIVPTLRSCFPNVQFILTTHSPQTVSTVPRDSVWLFTDVEGGRGRSLVHPDLQTEGEDAERVLGEVFDVDSLPPTPWRGRLSRLDALVDAPDTDAELRSLLRLVEDHFGGTSRFVAGWRARRRLRQRARG